MQIDDQFFADAGSKGEMFYATMAEIKESHRQVATDVAQVKDNVHSAAALASGNVEIEAGLGHTVDECRNAMLTQEEKQDRMVADMHQLLDGATRLVDDFLEIAAADVDIFGLGGGAHHLQTALGLCHRYQLLLQPLAQCAPVVADVGQLLAQLVAASTLMLGCSASKATTIFARVSSLPPEELKLQ